jgi:hypothetical protein
MPSAGTTFDRHFLVEQLKSDAVRLTERNLANREENHHVTQDALSFYSYLVT